MFSRGVFFAIGAFLLTGCNNSQALEEPFPDKRSSFSFFQENKGQGDEASKYVLKNGTTAIFFSPEEVIYSNGAFEIRQSFVGAKDSPTLQGENRRGVHGYKNIRYGELYSGIDLVFSGENSTPKYAYEVAPGVDYRQIQVGHSGADSVEINPDGAVVMKNVLGNMTIDKPFTYQVVNGERLEIESKYVLVSDTTYSFFVGEYDLTLPLIIDPTITVNSNADNNVRDSVITLREAIQLANGQMLYADLDPGEQPFVDSGVGAGVADTIEFNMGSGSITLTGALDHLNDTQPTTIDGYTQPGASPNTNATGALNGTLVVEINGNNATTYNVGFLSDNNVIRGLVINRSGDNGITSGSAADGNKIQGCYIGVNPAGTIARANAQNGIYVGGGNNWVIGTDGDGVNDAAERNMIASNSTNGVLLGDTTGTAIVAGNLIGTNGTSDLGNGNHGVVISGASNSNRIGTDGNGVSDDIERNVISGNTFSGVGVAASTSNVIAGNYLGTNAAGTSTIGNSQNGIILDNGDNTRIGVSRTNDANDDYNANERNIISGNAIGIDIINGSNGAVIAGNYIGTNAAGTADLGNAGQGIRILTTSHNARIGTSGEGGTVDTDERNVISGNNTQGIFVQASDGGIIAGNYIGTNAAGTAALGNTSHAIGLNVGSDNWIIGTDGSNDAFNANERNVLSGNSGYGVVIDNISDDNVVAGNYIGTNAAGTSALGNTGMGVQVSTNSSDTVIGTNGDGVADALEGNVISGNTLSGVFIDSSSFTVVAGNYVGTSASGTIDLGNGDSGVFLDSSNSSRIGTNGDGVSDTLERNVISGNNGTGGSRPGIYVVDGSTSNTISGNYIGTNAAGTGDLGNSFDGILIDQANGNTIGVNGDGSAGETNEGNVISGNDRIGILLYIVDSMTIAGNRIGTNALGTAALTNAGNGIQLQDGCDSNIIGTDGDGVSDALEGNQISGNQDHGIMVYRSSSNVMAGNIIGLNAAGNATLGNGNAGIQLYADTSASSSNRIGTNGDGTSDALERNIISGNSGTGIGMEDTDGTATSTGNIIAGNYIGTDITGLLAFGNGSDGIDLYTYFLNTIIGFDGTGTASVERNVITSSDWAGIYMWNDFVISNNTTISANYIGVGSDGTTPLGNSVGIWVDNNVNDIVIGGATTTRGNIIANSTADAGVAIINMNYSPDTDRNRISHNSIFNNFGMAIDLTADDSNYLGDGPDVNDAGDADDYANEEMNYPVITDVNANGSNISVYGTIDTSSATTATIEVYMTNGYAHSSGHGDLHTFLGVATPSDLVPGTWSLVVANSEMSPLISVIAIDVDGNTSEPSIRVASSGTGATAPDQVTNLQATAGDTEVDLTWDVPGNGGSAITDYVIQYGATTGFPGNASTFNDGTSTNAFATVNGLVNDTEYSFRVAAVNAIGQGLYSTVVTATPTSAPIGGTTSTDEAIINVNISDYISFSINNPASGNAPGGNQPFGIGPGTTPLTTDGLNTYVISGDTGIYTELRTTTNSVEGYNVSVYSVVAIGQTTALLRNGGTPGAANDQIAETFPRVGVAPNSNSTLNTATSTGLALRLTDANTDSLIRGSDEDLQWGTDDSANALWASLPLGPLNAQIIYDTMTFSDPATSAFINWFVGVNSNHPSGTFTGQQVFTATVN